MCLCKYDVDRAVNEQEMIFLFLVLIAPFKDLTLVGPIKQGYDFKIYIDLHYIEKNLPLNKYIQKNYMYKIIGIS